jgi:peptidoglycan/LPS O-acetylase OafA/YrhL
MNLPKHMPAVDGLRGVAILMVLLTHVGGGWPSAFSIYPADYEKAASLALPHWLRTIAGHAELGVALFFVVSAFTLTVRAAQDDGDLKGYAIRRIARVGPGYWTALVIYTLIGGLAPRLWAPNGISLADLIIAAAFGSAWGGGASLAVVPGGWSVVCEVAFYIALPALIWIIDGKIWHSLALTAIFCGIALLYALHAVAIGTYGFQFWVNPIEQAPVFLCGVTAALVAMRFRLPYLPGAAIVLVVVAVAVLPFQPVPALYLIRHLLFAGVVAIAVSLAAAHPPTVLTSRVMRRIGEVSYSMYLVHFALLAVSLRMAEWLVSALDVRTMLLHFFFTLIGSFAVASVTYRYVERPAIRWAAQRSRIPPWSGTL